MFLEKVGKDHKEAVDALDADFVAKLPFVANRKDVSNAPPDARFPNMNQTQHCWTKFNTFIMCMNHFEGADQKRCMVHRRHFKEMCPDRMTNQWIDQINDEVWVGITPKDPEIFAQAE